MNVEFNPEQLEAIAAIVAWFRSPNRKQIFFLTGQAGTGKTSLAREAARQCVPSDSRVEFIAPTGKAAARLRQKGCERARTLHSFAYSPRGEDEEGDPIFHEKTILDSLPSLVVMDEASMVGEYDMGAVTRHGIPILALGDLGQLPPVKAPYSLTPDHVDFELTQIMRQNADSNIIRAASFVRKGKVVLPDREYDDVRIRTGQAPLADLLEHSTEEAQVLCSYNSTRVGVNARVREALGFSGDIPQAGEKVMCTFNQHAHGLMNGEQGIVIEYVAMPEYEMESNDADDMMYLKLKSLSNGRMIKVKFNPASFATDADIAKDAQKSIGGFTYGYACTVHKSQGSEWNNVLVIDEPMGEIEKLRYTAYTRAAKRLTVYRRDTKR